MKIITMRILCAVLAMSTLTGAACEARIGYLDEDKVVIEDSMLTDESVILKHAARGCAVHGRVPEATGDYCIDDLCSIKHHEFACVEK